MNKKILVIAIIILIIISYSIVIILGMFSLGVISVHTDKKEYKPGENIIITYKNSGITVLCGVPYWYVYKIDNNSEIRVHWNELKGPQCKWPGEYFGVEGLPDIYSGPQGTYKIIGMVRVGGGFNTSGSKIITIR